MTEEKGWATLADGTRREFSSDEVKEIISKIEERKARMASQMPDEKSAIGMMFDAYDRLRQFGWREAMYAPKDGSHFQIIENGSTGIFDCAYSGEWPDGHWMVYDQYDCYPSSIAPALFRLYPNDEKERKRRMSSASAKFRMIDLLYAWQKEQAK